jgi:nucleotide-binding universal stress UspA family protein
VYQTILVPIADSLQSQRILPYATRLAAAAHGRIVLVQAVADRELRPRAESVLSRIQEDLRDQPFEVNVRIEAGDPRHVIVECARGTQADLIAMATDCQSDMDRWLNGSVSDSVLRHTNVPVLMVTPETVAWSADDARASSIVVPLDESPIAEEVLEPATMMAPLLNADLLLLHAIHDEAARPIANTYLTSVADQLRSSGLRVTTEVVLEDAVAAIQRAARQDQVSMIAMATHGRTGLARLMLGSVATHTVQHATVPILLVHPTLIRESPERQPESEHAPFVIVG